MGEARRGLGELVGALADLTWCAETLAAVPGVVPSEMVEEYAGLGETLLALGRPAEAVEVLERPGSLEGLTRAPSSVARLEFALARALWESRGDRPRAIQLAKTAAERYERTGFRAREAQAARAWLAARG